MIEDIDIRKKGDIGRAFVAEKILNGEVFPENVFLNEEMIRTLAPHIISSVSCRDEQGKIEAVENLLKFMIKIPKDTDSLIDSTFYKFLNSFYEELRPLILQSPEWFEVYETALNWTSR
jgi:hypothetical protein